MTAPALRLAVEIGGAGRHPAAWRRPDAAPTRLFTPSYHLRLAQLAGYGNLDFLAVPDSFVPPGDDTGAVRGSLDAVAIAARVAPGVRGLGVVPVTTVTHTEPFHISKAIATLDFVSSGFAGWEAAVSRTEPEAALFGRKHAAEPDELWREAAEAVEIVVRLWDSWEDGAEIRDAATGRFIDRDRLHAVGFHGEFLSVRGPSITPRPPQGHPLVVLRGDEPDALTVAARWADVVRIAAADLTAAQEARERVRAAVTAAGRDPDTVAVLLDVEVLVADSGAEARAELGWLDSAARPSGSWHQAAPPAGSLRFVGSPSGLADLLERIHRHHAADGVTLVPLALPSGLERIVRTVVPLLVGRGVRPPRPVGASLRERFGLARAENHYTQKVPV